MAVAMAFRGMLVSWLCERSSTVRQEDHSGTSGISVSLLLERFSSQRLGSSRIQRGMVCRSLCCRSSFITWVGGEEGGEREEGEGGASRRREGGREGGKRKGRGRGRKGEGGGYSKTMSPKVNPQQHNS